jgi:plasmid maintenance system antidote protein VapI
MPATANTKAKPSQADFSLRVKVRLLERGLSVSALARALGLNRNTVSLAINHDLFEPTRKRIAEHLSIRL